MVIDLNPRPTGNGTVRTTSGVLHNPGLEVMNGKVYFSGDTASAKSGLWCTDGTDTGTHLIEDFLNCSRFFAHNGILYFNISNTNRPGIWASDGTETGTSEIVPWYGAIEYQALGNEVYFNCRNSSITRIYKSNGLLTGTVNLGPCVGDFSYSGSNSGHHLRSSFLTAFNNKIYYANDKSLWSTDGTVAGTSVAFQDPGWFAGPLHLTVSGEKLYFKSIDSRLSELWESDGTSAGTHKIRKADANADFSTMPSAQAFQAYYHCGARQDICSFNNEVYFYNIYDTTLTASGTIRPQLYKYNTAPNAISRLPETSKINLYPNPSNNTVYISFEKAEFTHLTVTDQLGRSVYDGPLQIGDKSVSLQLGHLPSGLYHVRCFGPHSSSMSSVQIVH